MHGMLIACNLQKSIVLREIERKQVKKYGSLFCGGTWRCIISISISARHYTNKLSFAERRLRTAMFGFTKSQV